MKTTLQQQETFNLPCDNYTTFISEAQVVRNIEDKLYTILQEINLIKSQVGVSVVKMDKWCFGSVEELLMWSSIKISDFVFSILVDMNILIIFSHWYHQCSV